MKRDKVLVHDAICTNLEKFVLRKTLATKDHIFYDCLDVDSPNQANQETEADWWFPGARKEGRIGWTVGGWDFFWGDENVLELDRGDGDSLVNMLNWIVLFKKVNFMICEFYLSNENGVYNVKPHWTWRLNSNCTMGDFGYTGISGDTEPGSWRGLRVRLEGGGRERKEEPRRMRKRESRLGLWGPAWIGDVGVMVWVALKSDQLGGFASHLRRVPWSRGVFWKVRLVMISRAERLEDRGKNWKPGGQTRDLF